MTQTPREAIEIAREIARLKMRSDEQARASQARWRSVELDQGGGQNYYLNGERVATIGADESGNFIIRRAPEISPIPPIPSPPSATGRIGGIEVYWDGSFVDAMWNEAIVRVEVHAISNPDDPISDLTQIGSFVSRMGGALFYSISAAAGEMYFLLQTVNVAGVESLQSLASAATAIDAVDAAEMEALQAALDELNDVTLPALQTELDANTATLADLVTVSLPGLEDDLADLAVDTTANTTAITTLNTVTLPALQAEVDSAEVDIDSNTALLTTLTTVTLPDLQTELDAADAAIVARPRVIFATAQPGGLTADDRVIWYDSDGGYAASYWDGSTWAPYSLGAGALAADSVTATQIAAGAVTATEIAADAVIAAKIQAGAVVAGKIAADAVTATTIAAGAVTAGKIAALSITAAEIAAATITGTQVAATTITATNIAANTITATQIAANAITASELNALAVTAGKIATDAVTAGTIAADAVTAVKIAAGAVVAGKIAADAVTATTIATGAVTAGKIAANAVTAVTIAAGSITAGKIAANAITAGQIAAGSITATELNSNVLSAGFILTGAIQVGVSYWSAEDGIVIPQPNGGQIRLPSDGTTAQFDGTATLQAVSITGNLNILGATNKVSGLVKLANGIVEPTVAPSTFQSWPSVVSADLDGSTTPWRLYVGMASYHADTSRFVAAVNFSGTTLRAFDRSTGAYVASVLDNAQAWKSSFFTYGVTYTNGNYFVLGQDTARNNDYYIYKITATTGAKAAEYYLGPYDFYPFTPAIAANTALNQIHVFWCTTAGNGMVRVWGENFGDVSGPTLYNGYGIGVHHDSAWIGNGDFGSARCIIVVPETDALLTFTFPGMVWQQTESASSPEGTILRGIYYDSVAGRFKTYNKNGLLYTLSSHKTAQAITASYTWYDGAGTVRQTMEGPVTSYTIPPRTHLNVETSVPPDSGNTDAAQVDKANRVGIYVGVGAGLRKLQSLLGVDGSGVSFRKLTLDTIATGTANVPASNTFVGGTTSPGKIVSGAESGGVPLLTISGDGKINGQLIEDTGWTNLTLVNGWTASGTAARYRRRNGVVYVEGVILPGTNAHATGCATLPAGFRPGMELRLTGDTNSTSHQAGRFDIQAGGVIKPQGAVTWLDISCSFLAA